jgi:hypothetical protein
MHQIFAQKRITSGTLYAFLVRKDQAGTGLKLYVVEDAGVVVGEAEEVVVVVVLNLLILNALVIMKISLTLLLASKKNL